MSDEDCTTVLSFLFENFSSVKQDINAKNSKDLTAIDLAVEKHKFRLAVLLLQYGAKFNEDINTILKSLASAKSVYSKSRDEYETNSLLFINILLQEISKITNFNQIDKDGNTLLHKVVCQNDQQMACLLIELNVDLNIRNLNGNSALELAAERGLTFTILSLINKNASITKRTQFSSYSSTFYFETAAQFLKPILFDAIVRTDDQLLNEVINCIIRSLKHDILNSYNETGVTPLHFAAKIGNVNAVQTLIKIGADIARTALKSQKTPLHMVFECNDVDQVNKLIPLLTKGAINKLDANGFSPFHHAVYYNRYVMEFLRHGASITKTDSMGRTPLKLAISAYYNASDKHELKNYCRTIETLLDNGAGIFVNVDEMPPDVNTSGKLLIGFTINQRPVTRSMSGFEKAILNTHELMVNIENGASIDKENIMNLIDERLTINGNAAHFTDLKILKEAFNFYTQPKKFNMTM